MYDHLFAVSAIMFGLRKYVVVYVVAIALIVCTLTVDAWQEWQEVTLICLRYNRSQWQIGANKTTVPTSDRFVNLAHSYFQLRTDPYS